MKHLKSLFCLTLCLALCAALSVASFAQTEATWGDVQQDNFLRITSADAWNAGTAENLTVTTEVGDGALRLSEGQTDGTWISQELDVPAFEYMVASWSADTPAGTWVEIQARAYVDMYDQWSGWLSWGKWSPYIKRGSANTTEDLAKVDTDTFTIRGSDGETSSRIQFRFLLHSDDAAVTPTLRDVSATLQNTLSGQAIPVYHANEGMELPEKVLLDTPAYSQMRRDSAIGSVICSPTSMTMMLNDRNSALDLFPEEVALREYDFNYEGFGNWSFTTAIAGSYGYSVSCQYADLDVVRQELACGRSVALSVRYSNSTSGSYPYLENGAANNTAGHLICIVGYETIDGVDYFYSNDAADNTDLLCAHRCYRADQLDACWSSRIAYLVSAQPEEGAGAAAPQRIAATLEATDKNDVFRLMVDGEEVSLHKSFANKTSVLSAGTAFFIADDAATDPIPAPAEITTANSILHYVGATGQGQIYISTAKMQDLGITSGTCYIILNNGPTYMASVTFPEAEPSVEDDTTDIPTDDTAEPAPEEQEPVTAEPVEKSSVSPAIIVIGVAIVAAAVLVLVKSKKK